MVAWPLLGRDQELDLITAEFRDSAGVLIAGHAGTGRTTLARQALSTLAASGVPTVWILATRSAAGIPFGAMAHLLPLGSLPAGEPISTMQALTERVVELGVGSRVAIGVDDAHLLDDASAATLAALALRSAAYLVITARAGRAVPDALATLVKDGLVRRVELGALPESVVDTLIDLSLDGPVAGLARHRLHAECAGNPLVLHEFLHRGLQTSTLRRTHGLWWWHDDPPPREPLLGTERLGLVFELVALGGTVPLRVIERLAGRDGIEAAERTGQVRVERSANRVQLRAADPPSGATIRALLPISRTRDRFRLLSSAALALPMRRAGDALRVARWQLAAGSATHPEVLLAGAREALHRFDLHLAERLARTGRDVAPGDDADQLLAEILVWRGQNHSATAIVGARVGTLTRSTMDNAVQFGYDACLAQLGSGNLTTAWDLADGGYQRAIRAGAPLPAGGWAALRGLVGAAQGRMDVAGDSLREAVLALGEGDPFRLLRCCLAGLALVSALRGDAVDANAWLRRADQPSLPANSAFEPVVELCRAWTQATQGRASAAAHRAAALAQAAGLHVLEALALYDVVRLGGITDHARLGELSSTVDTPLVTALADAATGLTTADDRLAGDLLAAASTRFESLGHYLLATEAGYAAASALRRVGHRASANVQMEKATALHEICAGARTRLLAHDDVMAVLTRREREVVLLAPTHTSRQISALLGLTVRTVDNYLARSYVKLGITGRPELRDLSTAAGRFASS